MNAPDRAGAKSLREWWMTPPRPGLQRFIHPWAYRHLRFFGVTRVVGGSIQEAMPGDVPDNMATELEQPKALTRIVFCDQRLQQKVTARYPDTALDLTYLSHLGQFADKRGYDPRRAFTLTNTDEIPALVELLKRSRT
jgi:hypothetical protein